MGRKRSAEKALKESATVIDCIPVGFQNRRHFTTIVEETGLDLVELLTNINCILRRHEAVIIADRHGYYFRPENVADFMDFIEAAGITALIPVANQWNWREIQVLGAGEHNTQEHRVKSAIKAEAVDL